MFKNRYCFLFGVFLLIPVVFAKYAVAVEQPIIGVCTHFGHGTRDVTKSLAFARYAGFKSIRDEVLWSHVESAPDTFYLKPHHDFVARATSGGMKVLLVLGYGNGLYGSRVKPLTTVQMDHFKKYVRFVVSTFRSNVWGYEIWNEYDGKAGTYPLGAADDYAEMVKEISPIIRELDPKAKVLAGAMTPVSVGNGWLDRFLAMLDIQMVDGISIHPYAQGRSEKAHEVEYAVDLVKTLSNKVDQKARKSGVLSPRIYVTEMGWQTAEGLSEVEVSNKVNEFLRSVMKINTVAGVWIYELENSGTNPKNGEHVYGVFQKGFVNQRYPISLDKN